MCSLTPTQSCSLGDYRKPPSALNIPLIPRVSNPERRKAERESLWDHAVAAHVPLVPRGRLRLGRGGSCSRSLGARPTGVLSSAQPTAPWLTHWLSNKKGGPTVVTLGGSVVKESAYEAEDQERPQIRSLGGEDPLEEGMTTHSGILALENPMDRRAWRLQPILSHRVRHNWSD